MKLEREDLLKPLGKPLGQALRLARRMGKERLTGNAPCWLRIVLASNSPLPDGLAQTAPRVMGNQP